MLCHTVACGHVLKGKNEFSARLCGMQCTVPKECRQTAHRCIGYWTIIPQGAQWIGSPVKVARFGANVHPTMKPRANTW